jgi:hypothetical protein
MLSLRVRHCERRPSHGERCGGRGHHCDRDVRRLELTMIPIASSAPTAAPTVFISQSFVSQARPSAGSAAWTSSMSTERRETAASTASGRRHRHREVRQRVDALKGDRKLNRTGARRVTVRRSQGQHEHASEGDRGEREKRTVGARAVEQPSDEGTRCHAGPERHTHDVSVLRQEGADHADPLSSAIGGWPGAPVRPKS